MSDAAERAMSLVASLVSGFGFREKYLMFFMCHIWWWWRINKISSHNDFLSWHTGMPSDKEDALARLLNNQ
jgi:hypothetical protein